MSDELVPVEETTTGELVPTEEAAGETPAQTVDTVEATASAEAVAPIEAPAAATETETPAPPVETATSEVPGNVEAEAAPARKPRARAARTEEPAEAAAPAASPVASVAIDFGAAGAEQHSRGRRKLRIGKVVSNKMLKTVVVAVESKMRHPLYGKIMRRTKKFKAHDEHSQCGEGDTVEIVESRPLSREKRWRVVRIVEKAK